MKKPYEIRCAYNGEYYYCMVGANGEVMSTSETYPTKKGAKQAVIDAANRIHPKIWLYRDWSFWATDKIIKK